MRRFFLILGATIFSQAASANHFSDCVTSGTPVELRNEVWFKCSGAKAQDLYNNPGECPSGSPLPVAPPEHLGLYTIRKWESTNCAGWCSASHDNVFECEVRLLAASPPDAHSKPPAVPPPDDRVSRLEGQIKDLKDDISKRFDRLQGELPPPATKGPPQVSSLASDNHEMRDGVRDIHPRPPHPRYPRHRTPGPRWWVWYYYPDYYYPGYCGY